MGPSEWIALVAVLVTVLGGLLALWFQGGRILERLNNLGNVQRKHDRRLDDHEKRLHRAELIIEPLK